MEKFEEDLDKQIEQTEGGHPAAEKEVGGGLTADEEGAVAGEAGGKQMTKCTDRQIGKTHGKSRGE